MRARRTFTKIEPIEKVAAGFLVLLLAGSWLHDLLYRELWIVGSLVVALIWCAAFLLAGFSIWWGVNERATGWRRARLAAVMPAALMLAWIGSGPALMAGRWTSARWQLWQHLDEYEAAAARTPGRPVAFEYLHGIPDGGVAIIRWHGDPKKLPAATQADLTGERVLWCQQLSVEYHLCGYD